MSVKALAACWLLISVLTRVPMARPQAIEAPHESPPRMNWVPTAYSGSGNCEPWIRDNYVSIQVNVDARGCNIHGDVANEPSIAVDPSDPRKMAIGWRQFDDGNSIFRQAGYAYSQDGGHSWLFPGSLAPGTTGTDPVLASSGEGIFYFLSTSFDETEAGGRLRLFKSSSAGLTWDEPLIVLNEFIDKPWMTIDATNGTGRGNVYVRGVDRLWRSGGGTPFEELFPGDLGPFVTMTVDVSGVLLMADASSRVQKSVDVQDLSQNPTFYIPGFAMRGFYTGAQMPPNPGGLCGQPWIATDHSNGATRGNVYYLASVVDPDTRSVDVRFARSIDAGESWAQSIRVNDDPPENEAYHWFGMMSVAPNGRIDAVWNDTRNGGGAPNLCELFYSYSVDAGDTWSANVPVSPMFDSWVGWPGGQRKLGDYYHMVSDNLGVNVAYAATFNGEQDIYFLRIGPWDCNGNEIDDVADITALTSKDCNANEVPDECEYRVDIDGDGLTTLDDYMLFQAALAGPPAPFLNKEGVGGGPIDCFELYDADHNGQIDLIDYAYLQRVFVSP